MNNLVNVPGVYESPNRAAIPNKHINRDAFVMYINGQAVPPFCAKVKNLGNSAEVTLNTDQLGFELERSDEIFFFGELHHKPK